MAEITPTEIRSGHNRSDDVDIQNYTFAADNDVANIDTRGFEYIVFMPFGTDADTNPTSGTVVFDVFAMPASVASPTFADFALIPEDSGNHLRATVTSTARTAGYLTSPPQKIMLRMAVGVDGADLSIQVQMRKTNARGTIVGKG